MRRFESPYLADWFAALCALVCAGRYDLVAGIARTIGQFAVLGADTHSSMEHSDERAGGIKRSYEVSPLYRSQCRYILSGLSIGHRAVTWSAFCMGFPDPIRTGAIYFDCGGALISTGLFILWQDLCFTRFIANGFFLLLYHQRMFSPCCRRFAVSAFLGRLCDTTDAHVPQNGVDEEDAAAIWKPKDCEPSTS